MARPRKHEYGKAKSRLTVSRAALIEAGGRHIHVALQPEATKALEELSAISKENATRIINRLILDAYNAKA